MVTSTAGLTCDTTTNSTETSETRNNVGNSNTFSEVKKNSDDKTAISVEKVVSHNNDIQRKMSTDQASTNTDLNSETGIADVALAPTSRQSCEPQTNGLSLSSPVTANGPIQTFVSSTYSNYGPYSQSPLSSTGKPGPNIPGFQPSMQSRFPVNQPSSSTPTLNQLLAAPSRFQMNSSDPSGEQSTQSQSDISRHQRQSWEQDPGHQRPNISIASSNPEMKSGNISSMVQAPQQPPEYYPPPQHGYPPSQPRYPAPISNQMPPYNQSQQAQFNSSMPPPLPGGSSYSQAPPQHPVYPYQGYHNTSQQPYYARQPSPAHGARMDSPQVAPQHPPDSPFQHPKERMMSPSRRTPQPAAVPSPMSAGSSPHRQGSLSSIPQYRGQSPSRASPALSATSNTPLSPNMVRPGNPQLSPSIRGSDGADSNKPSPVPAGLGYPSSYRSSASPSPYAAPTPNPPPGMMSPPQASYPGIQQQLNIQQEPMQTSAPVGGGKPLHQSHGTMAQPYNQPAQPPMGQQPSYNSPQYPVGISQSQPMPQGYNSASPRPAPAPGPLPSAVADPGQAVRRGAAAAAAAAMAAAAHSAQPGHVAGQRHTAPNYYSQTSQQQQLRTPHPNYSNVQAGADAYQKPYRPLSTPRMPVSGAQHQMPSPGMQRMHPPASPGYRHPSMPGPPEQYPGYYQSNEPPQTPGYQSTPGGYNQQQYQPQDTTPKKPLAKSLSQKLASLFEPPEPGRREFIEAVLRYWEEKDIPLKNAPLMGRKTVDLFRLYHIVKQNGGMQEVTSRKKWAEISSMLGLGTTSSSGFTLKKQYCKYLYGYECKERGQPEPQEAMARMTEANRKSRKALEAANEEARMASMSPRHLMQSGTPHHPYPPQNYPPGQYPHPQQYRPPPPQPASTNQAYMMPRTMTPPAANSYPPGYPNHSGGTVHHTSMPPPQHYANSQPNVSYGQLSQQATTNPAYLAPASSLPQPTMSSLPGPSAMATPNKSFVQQQPPIPVPTTSISHPASSIYLPLSTSSSTLAGSMAPNSSFGSSIPAPYPSSQVSTTLTPTSLSTGAPPPQSYPHAAYDSYRLPPGPAPSYPASNSPLPQARPPAAQQYVGSRYSPSPKPAMPYSPRSSSPLRPPQPRTPNYPSASATYRLSSSPGLKRQGSDAAGPPNKVFRHESPNVLSSLPPSLRLDPEPKGHRRSKSTRFSNTISMNSSSPGDFGTFRSAYSHKLPQYRMSGPRYPTSRTPQRWPQTSMSSRPFSRPLSYPQSQNYDPRARRPLQLHRTPMAQQFKREFMHFPHNSVEATPLRLTKFQRKSCNNVGLIESWRIIMALKSGLLAESSWALNVLNIFLYDQKSVAQFRLSQLPGLLDAVVEYYRRHLCEVFTLPYEQEAIGVKSNSDDNDTKNDTAIKEDNTILRQIRLLSKKTTDRSLSAKLNSRCTKYNIKIEPRRNPFIIDKSHHWDRITKTGLYDDINHIVVETGRSQGQTLATQQEKVNSCSKEEFPVVEATLEEVLSIPCTVLYPDVYNVMQTSIDIWKAEEEKLDKKLKLDLELKSTKIKAESKDTKKTTQSPTQMCIQVKYEPNSSDIKSKIVNGDLESTTNSTKSIKTEPVSSPTQCSTKETLTHKLNDAEKDKDGKEVIKNNVLVNGEATQDEKMKQGKISTDFDLKPEMNCKMEVDRPNEHKIEDSTPQTLCKQETKPNISEKLNGTVKEESCEQNVNSSKQDAGTIQPDIKEDYDLKNLIDSNTKTTDKTTNFENCSLMSRVQLFLEKRNVLLLEDEAYGRDGTVFDPLSGPLLCCESTLSENDLASRLGAISNILRSLSFISINHADFCRHSGLMRSLSGILLLRHKHKLKRKRKLDFENVEELKEKIKDVKDLDDLNQLIDDFYLENDKCRYNSKIKTGSFITDENAHDPTTNSTGEKTSASSELFAPKEESKLNTKIQKSTFSAVVLDEEDADEVYADLWWWDTVQRVREDALVILSNISSTLNLSLMPDDRIALSVIDACLHFALCPSSDACDVYSSKPRDVVSPQRLALEILTKLSIKDENVQLMLAIRPFSKLEKLFAFLIRLICDRKDQAVQEFAIVLISNFSKNDQSIARVIALQKSAISCLTTFLEACEETAINNRDCLRLSSMVTNCGSTEFIMTKAALALYTLASVTENKPSFMKYQLRLLALSMSQLLGKQVTAILSSVLYALTHDSQ